MGCRTGCGHLAFVSYKKQESRAALPYGCHWWGASRPSVVSFQLVSLCSPVHAHDVHRGTDSSYILRMGGNIMTQGIKFVSER